MFGSKKEPKPKKAIDLDTWQGKLSVLFQPDYFRRRGWVHVIWVDTSKVVRNYLGQQDGETIHIEQAGPQGQTFLVPKDLNGMAWDRRRMLCGLWCGNDPAQVPFMPGLDISPVKSHEVAAVIKRAIRVRSDTGSWWEQNRGFALSFMILIGIGIAAAMVLGGVSQVLSR